MNKSMDCKIISSYCSVFLVTCDSMKKMNDDEQTSKEANEWMNQSMNDNRINSHYNMC